MSVQLSQLSRPAANRIRLVYTNFELGYYAAYKRHYEISGKLSSDGYHRESYHTLLFSIECYLKDTFCICRFYVVGDVNTVPYAPLLKALQATGFSHLLADASLMLQTLLPELQTDADYALFHSLLPKKATWNEERYNDPAQDPTDYSQKYSELSQAFVDVIEKVLGGIK